MLREKGVHVRGTRAGELFTTWRSAYDTETERFVLYLASGGTAVLVWYAVLIGLVELFDTNKTLASVIGFAVGMPVNYILQRRFVFKASGPDRLYFPRYVAVTLATMGLNALMFWSLVEVVGLNYLVGQTISTGLVVVVNYLVNRTYTFAKIKEAAVQLRT